MLLLLLSIAVAAEAQVGYLLTPRTNVKVVRAVIPLTLNVTPLANLYNIIVGFEDDLASITEVLADTRNCTVNPEFIDHWLWQLENVNMTLNSIVHTSLMQDDIDPTTTTTLSPDTLGNAPSIRRKRGLFDFLGIAQKWFIGTATMGDIRALQKEADEQKTRIDINSVLLQTQARKLGEIAHLLNEVSAQVTLLSDGLDTLNNKVNINSLVDSLYTQVTYYGQLFMQMLNTLNLLTRGVVTPTLLPYSTLTGIVNYAMVVEGLFPAVDDNRIEDYYSLIQVDFDDRQILLYLPFVDEMIFDHFELTPFPSLVDNKSLILTDVASDILLSEDSSFIAMTSPSVLDSCLISYDFFVCLPSHLDFHKPTDTCEYRIVTKSNNISMCNFDYVDVTQVLRQEVDDLTWLYFPQRTPVVVACPNTPPKPSHGWGRLPVAKDCTVSSAAVTLWGVAQAASAVVTPPLQRPSHVQAHDTQPLVPHFVLPTVKEEVVTPDPWITQVVNDASHPWMTAGLLLLALLAAGILLATGVIQCYKKRRALMGLALPIVAPELPPVVQHVAA